MIMDSTKFVHFGVDDSTGGSQKSEADACLFVENDLELNFDTEDLTESAGSMNSPENLRKRIKDKKQHKKQQYHESLEGFGSSEAGPSGIQFAGLSQTLDFSNLPSLDIYPLMSMKQSRRSTTLLAHIRKSVTLNKLRNRSHDEAVLASEDLIIGLQSHKDCEDIPKLLNEIRSLPCPMHEKRTLRNDLLVTLAAYQHTLPKTISGYIEAPKKIPKIIRTFKNDHNLWKSSLKKIEGRFGTGVVSYFVFLRWLFFLNLIIFLTMFVFGIFPQLIGRTTIDLSPDSRKHDHFANRSSNFFKELRTRRNSPDDVRLPQTSPNVRRNDKLLEDLGALLDTYAVDGFVDAVSEENTYANDSRVLVAKMCNSLYKSLIDNMTQHGFIAGVQGLLEGSEWMEDTLLFTGYYVPHVNIGKFHYHIASAFIVILLVLIIVNIYLMMTYASAGVQESALAHQNMYCYVMFCGWDFAITDDKASKAQHRSIHQEFKSTLAEERQSAVRKEWTAGYKARIFAIRTAMNLITILMLVLAYYLIYLVAKIQLKAQRQGTATGLLKLFFQFLPSLTMTTLNFVLPFSLFILVIFENYSVEEKINVLLCRIILLRGVSLIILISSFYEQITCEPKNICGKGYENCPSPICWETYVGQQLYRLSIMDLFVHLSTVFCWEVPRKFIQRRYENKWTLSMGTEFDIPSQVLGLIYSQTLCWLGMFYCPLLPAIMTIKTVILFYLKKFTVLRNFVPAKIPYKASRSNAIFIVVSMLYFFITIGVLGYSITQIEASDACSPYCYNHRMIDALDEGIKLKIPVLSDIIRFVFSPLFAYPVIILMCLTLYYFITKMAANKKMMHLLKIQLTMEGKDKQFLLDRVSKIRVNSDDVKNRTK